MIVLVNKCHFTSNDSRATMSRIGMHHYFARMVPRLLWNCCLNSQYQDKPTLNSSRTPPPVSLNLERKPTRTLAYCVQR
jgi:hypothetical protein